MIEGHVLHRQGPFTLDVAFSMGNGRSLGIFGPSGSGKTTTLRAIAGLVRPAGGRITIGGETVFDAESGAWTPPHKRRVGYMPQQYALFPHLTVRKNIAFGLQGWATEEADRRILELAALFHIDDLMDRRPSSLSSGQQQRVALASALAPRPRVLVLDEPFSALDQGLRHELRREIKTVQDRASVPMVIVSHDWADMVALCDRMVTIERGRVTSEGTPTEILKRPAAGILPWPTSIDNVFEGFVTLPDKFAGVTACTIGGELVIEAPYFEARQGDPVRIGIRAGDILLAIERPRSISARNIIPGRVVSTRAGDFETEVIVEAISGITASAQATFRVEITPRAVASLGIAPGLHVWLIIKTNSCFVLA